MDATQRAQLQDYYTIEQLIVIKHLAHHRQM